MSTLWVSDYRVRHWHLKKPCEEFERKYDQVQNQILNISCMNDLLSGKIALDMYVQVALLMHDLSPLWLKVVVSLGSKIAYVISQDRKEGRMDLSGIGKIRMC